MILIILASLFFFSGMTIQEKYDYCKKENFVPVYCEKMKKLDKIGARKY